MLISTLYIVVLTLVIVTPVGLSSAIYLTQYAKQGRLVRVIRFATEVLSGVPSVLFGLFGYTVFCHMLGLGTSILAGCLTMTLCILPTIVRTTEESLLAVPESYKEGALALGASRLRVVMGMVLPCAMPGVLTAVILGMGRIVGESAALLFTAGMGLKLLGGFFTAMGGSGATLSVALYIYAMERGKFDVAFAVAAVLMLIVLIVNFAAKRLGRRLKNNQ